MAKIDVLLKEMVDRGASDLHMVPGMPPMLRLKGEVVPTNYRQLTNEMNEQLFAEILTEEQVAKYHNNLDYDCAYEIAGVARFRCNFFYQQRGAAAVFRVIPTKILSLEALGMPSGVNKLLAVRKGLVLVTGPTGSGKSTTLAAMIDKINDTREEHIITIEDPLEFVHQNKRSLITQREIGTHAQSFTEALKVASREDPNIILVGEMRDLETISLALTCAELGILVYGTLHTNSAAKTIDRIINAFPADQQNQMRSMLSESLKGILAQQLLKTADGKGRCAAIEILVGTSSLGNLVREAKISQITSMIQTGASEGMQTMDQALQKLVDESRITVADAYAKAIDKSLFEAQMEETTLE
ncbi:MAG: type IV pilus twitching motility protein PilT [Thermodesulfobacteriota bacterium]